MKVENSQSSTGTRVELDAFMLGLVPIIEANDMDLTRASSGAFGRFAGKPVGEGPELDALKALMSKQLIGQFAALTQGV